jgi:hypothetical protein
MTVVGVVMLVLMLVLVFVGMFMVVLMVMFMVVGMLMDMFILLQTVNGNRHVCAGDAAGSGARPHNLYAGQTQSVHLVHKSLRIGK